MSSLRNERVPKRERTQKRVRAGETIRMLARFKGDRGGRLRAAKQPHETPLRTSVELSTRLGVMAHETQDLLGVKHLRTPSFRLHEVLHVGTEVKYGPRLCAGGLASTADVEAEDSDALGMSRSYTDKILCYHP